MKVAFAFILIAVLMTIAVRVDAASYMILPIDEVYDGDTIKTHIGEHRLKAPLNKLSVRVFGIDTPENPAKSYFSTGKLGRAKCVKEAELAIAAKNEVIRLSKGFTKMRVYDFDWGKFGGRILGRVTIGGVDVGKHLIEKGMAVPYFGEKKSKDWCA